jgi:diacylglycerol O-acyltransferase / wax synthase
MEQLSGADNASLFGEHGNVFNHVGTLIVYDASTAPGGKVRFKDILEHFEQRLYLHPVFRRHLATVPFGIDRPYWVTADEIDIEYHIRHISLPQPGDWRQLMIQVARLHSRPLNRDHPMWEAYVIEGLDNIPNLPKGAFAVFLKIHHSVVDGLAAVHLISQLHSATAVCDLNVRQVRRIIADIEPTAYETVSRGLINQIGRLGKAARLSVSLGARLLTAGRAGLGEMIANRDFSIGQKLAALGPQHAPETRFDGKVSPNRVMEGFGMPLSRIRRIREKVPGATLNDVLLAMAGGAVHKYLQARGELPEASLAALMPISLRSEGSAGGNDVTGVSVLVRSDLADPLERLRAVHHAALDSRHKAEKAGLDLLKNLVDIMPPIAVNLLVNRFILPSINMAVSNVRGPEKPMYLAGAKAMCLYPASIPADGGGLNLTGVSYNGVMWVSMVSCRRMVPDPNVMLECMRASWNELLEAADKLPHPGHDSATPAASRRRKTPAA